MKLDDLLEGLIAPSFSAVGYRVRSKEWDELSSYDLTGRTVAITGPTSGLGLAATHLLAGLGADLVLLARNREKLARLVEDLDGATGRIDTVVVDMGSLDGIREAGAELLATQDRLDVLIHNAGALTNDRRTTADGLELTTAVHVVGPFLLTGLLMPLLRQTEGSRVLTMSSGGMYSAPLAIGSLEMPEDRYKGAEQYARAKRAQVTLNAEWARRVPHVAFHALHPGWADTPGVEESLPTFRKVVGRFLRTPQEGADTLVWLAADDAGAHDSGRFWHDRAPRAIHRLGSTRRSDTPERRIALWDRIATMADWDLAAQADDTIGG
ncbi:MAG: SDR family NAD(P)-dependent oxidoreductase [Acidimicrobiia bacterium]|nr:SDR family NAD(P)-dependent oxidoreductase [Acidimicrobiia bacterium]